MDLVLLERFSVHKPARPDGLHPNMIKTFVPLLTGLLTFFDSKILVSGVMLSDWKPAIIKPRKAKRILHIHSNSTTDDVLF